MHISPNIWRYAIATGGLHTEGGGQLDKLPVPAVKVYLESAVGVEWC